MVQVIFIVFTPVTMSSFQKSRSARTGLMWIVLILDLGGSVSDPPSPHQLRQSEPAVVKPDAPLGLLETTACGTADGLVS
jgi:hypothetical protein